MNGDPLNNNSIVFCLKQAVLTAFLNGVVQLEVTFPPLHLLSTIHLTHITVETVGLLHFL